MSGVFSCLIVVRRQEHHPARVHIRIREAPDLPVVQPEGEHGGEHSVHSASHDGGLSSAGVYADEQRHAFQPAHAVFCFEYALSRVAHMRIIAVERGAQPSPRAAEKAGCVPE